jgi:hypothetical protein
MEPPRGRATVRKISSVRLTNHNANNMPIPHSAGLMEADEFVQRIELCDPEKVFSRVIAQNLEVLDIGTTRTTCSEVVKEYRENPKSARLKCNLLTELKEKTLLKRCEPEIFEMYAIPGALSLSRIRNAPSRPVAKSSCSAACRVNFPWNHLRNDKMWIFELPTHGATTGCNLQE